MNRVEKYNFYEIVLDEIKGSEIVEYCAKFSNGDVEKTTFAFKNTEEEYIVRFMPEKIGIWQYKIDICGRSVCGEFECIENSKEYHGLVITNGFQFSYKDKEKYIPIGTTCYAWVCQPEELQEETVKSLKNSPFNKIRMGIFPKSMPYNNNEPLYFPYLKNELGDWDIDSPNPIYWANFDKRMKQLLELGIEVDLILFHPYDRWGFSTLDQKNSLKHLKYCIARLGAYRNIWWSLANEYEMLYEKIDADWDEYGKTIYEYDIYHHLTSIHNILIPYPKKEWMTHCSIQSGEINNILKWKKEYEVPIVIDECGYEGNIEYDWGNLSAFEMVHRFWWTITRGGFCTHGETFHRDDEILWWAKGGKLYGESVQRIQFMKEILYSLPKDWKNQNLIIGNMNPNAKDEKELKTEKRFKDTLDRLPKETRAAFTFGIPMAINCDGYYLQYFGKTCPVYTKFELWEDKRYSVEVIDVWDMTRTVVIEECTGKSKVDLPAKEGIAILVKELK